MTDEKTQESTHHLFDSMKWKGLLSVILKFLLLSFKVAVVSFFRYLLSKLHSGGSSHRIDLRTWKVMASKSLKISPTNDFDTTQYDDFHLVCIDSDKVIESSGCLNYSKFKNVVGVLIKVENIKDKLIDRIIINLNHKLRKNPEFFIQIFIKSKKCSKIYLKTKNFENFKEVLMLTDQIEFKKRFKNTNFTFNVQDFCETLKCLNLPIDELTFDEIFNFLELHKGNEKILQFLKCTEDDFLIRIFRGFDIKLPKYLIRNAVTTENSKDIFHALKCVHFSEFSAELVETLLNTKNCKEILKSIAQRKDLNYFKGLLQHPGLIQKYINFNLWSNLRKFSLEIHSFDVQIQLQGIECFYFQQFDEVNSKNPKNTLEAIDRLHRSISNSEEMNISNSEKILEEVKIFVESYSDFKFCVDKNQVCALEKSIGCKKFEIYSFLRSKDFISYNKIRLKEKLKNLTSEENEEINNFNLKYVKSSDDDFVHILYSKCDLFSCHGKFSSSEIWEMHKILSKIEGLQWIMKNASKSEIQIIFDLKTVGINVIDHNQKEVCHGVAYNETKKLYLSRNVNKLERYGTFAHELTHYVMFLVYENYSLPYCEHDLERKAQWEAIVEKCKTFHETANFEKINKIIERAFTYEPEKIGTELTVKVPELLAYFYEDQEKLKEIRENYSDIFDYFYKLVLNDLKIPYVIKMNKLNQDFKLFKHTEDSKLNVTPDSKVNVLKLSTKTSRRILLTSNVPQLILSQFVNQVKNQPGNKLNLKVRNIYVDLQKLDQEHIKKDFKNLLSKAKVDRIIVKATSSSDKNLNFINNLKPETSCFVVSFDSSTSQLLIDNLKFIHHSLNFSWSDLTQESKDFLIGKKVKFQNLEIKVSELLANYEKSISPEILLDLCANDELQVNFYSKPKELDNFIKRRVEKKHPKTETSSLNHFYDVECSEVPFKSYMSVDNFLDITVDKAHIMNIVIISDMAGSGKSTLLKKIAEILTLKKFPSHWICLISLRDHIKMFSECGNEPFVDFIAKILKLDAFSKEVFTQKYSQGKAKILFDDFDEIPPSCKKNALLLMKSFIFFKENQIFVATQPNLGHDLEKELKASNFNLKILEEYEQIEFLTKLWRKSHPDSVLIEKCASSLVKKISKRISTSLSDIGLPLIVIGLAEVFKNKIKENFEAIIENLDITEIYRNITEKSLEHANFSKKFEEILKKKMSFFQIHVTLSVVAVFDEDFANELGLTHDKNEWPQEEVERGGIFKYDSEGKSVLNHLTYAHYFIAGYALDFIKNSKKPSESQLKLLTRILSEEKFKIMRMFLDNMLEKVESFNDLKTLKSSEYFSKSLDVKVKDEIFNTIIKEEFSILCSFFLQLTKEHDINTEIEGVQTNLMKILPLVKNINFEKVIDNIFGLRSENVFNEFLIKTDGFQNLILHHFLKHCSDAKKFKLFWRYIKRKNLTHHQIEEMFTHKNQDGQTFFQIAFHFNFDQETKLVDAHREIKKRRERNEILFKIATQQLSEEKLMIMLDNESDKFSLFYYDFSFELALKVFSDENKVKEIFNDEKALMILLLVISSENFPLLWFKIEKNHIDVKNLLTQGSHNALALSALNPEIFSLVFAKAKSFCEKQNEHENLIFKEIPGEKLNLLEFTLFGGTLANVKLLFEEIIKNFGFERVKFFFKKDDFKIASKLIECSCCNRNQTNTEIIDFLQTTLKEFFTGEEISQILHSKNEGRNIICEVAFDKKSIKDLKYSWFKIKSVVQDEIILKKSLLMKDVVGLNVMQNFIVKKEEEIFLYLFEKVYCEIFKLEEFIFEVDHENETFFHNLTRYGSPLMLEAASKQLVTQLSREELIQYLKLKSKFADNVLHMTACNASIDSISFLIPFLENQLTKVEIKEFLSTKGNFSRFPLHNVLIFSTPQAAKLFVNLYQKYFSQDEILEFCSKKEEQFDQDIFEIASEESEEMSDVVESLMHKRN